MEKFEKLRSIAQEIGCDAEVQGAETRAKELLDQTRVKIVVSGMRGSGKTTFINKMVGNTVREAGNMDDNEKPLRVAFEKMADDNRYECATIVNHEWNTKDAIIYELRDSEVFSDKQLSGEMDDKDIVFFLISATAPFNSDEVRILKALSPLHRQVVLTGLDIVKENERKKVLEYVEKLNASLGLPPVFVFNENEDVGHAVRNLLPGWVDLTELRQTHINGIFEQALSLVERKIASAKAENDQQMTAAGQNEEAEIAYKKAKTNWYTIRTDLLERQLKVADEVTLGLQTAGAAETRRLLNKGKETKFSEEWQRNAGAEANAAYSKMVAERLEILRDLYIKDVQKASSDAAFLRLIGYNENDFIALEKYAPADLSQVESNDQSVDFKVPNISVIPGSDCNTFKIMLGTGALVGGFILMPLPTAIKLVGLAASVGVGGSYFMNKRTEEIGDELESAFADAFQLNLTNAEKGLRQATEICYSKAIAYIRDKEDGLQAPKPDISKYMERQKTLDTCEKLCANLKQ